MKLVVLDIRGKLGTFQLLEWKKCNGKEGSDRWEQVLEEYFRIPGNHIERLSLYNFTKLWLLYLMLS